MSLCVAMLVGAVPAWATTPLIDIGFNNLTGSFNSGTKIFTALDNALTNGTVQRIRPTSGTAYFNSGYGGPADFALSMVISNVTATSATGVGSFLITDANGTTFGGDLTGTWTFVNLPLLQYAVYSGEVSNAVFGGNADGLFEGPSGGSFSTDFSPSGLPFYGAVVTLQIGKDWFKKGSFSGAVDNLVMKIVPAPGAILLAALGLGGLGLIRRRLG